MVGGRGEGRSSYLHRALSLSGHRDSSPIPWGDGLRPELGYIHETLCEPQLLSSTAQGPGNIQRQEMGHSPQSRPPAQHLLGLLGSLLVGAGRDLSPQQRRRLPETPALEAEVGGPADGLQGSAVQEEGRGDDEGGRSPKHVSPPTVDAKS